mgnify:CR=1 FL=1
MKQRRLGKNGPLVSAIGLGRGSQPVQFDTPLEKEFNDTIHRAIDLGINLFDSSDAYWGTRHEVLLGRAIKGRRDRALVATKFGNIDLPDGRKAPNAKPEYVVQCCEASLKRLDVDVIDLFYLHRVDPNTPIEDTVGAMKKLVEQGKVRHLALSEAGAQTIRRAHKVHPIACVETEYSLWSRDVESEVLPACRELGIALMAYAPLGRGFLTGTLKTLDTLLPKDRRREHPRFSPDNIQRNAGLLAPIERIAAAHKCTTAQIALAWVHAQGSDIFPIPGTKRRSYLEINAGAAALRLDAQDLRALDDVGAASGERYTPRSLACAALASPPRRCTFICAPTCRVRRFTSRP